MLVGTNRPQGWVRTNRKWVRIVLVWVRIVWVRKIHGYETTGYHVCESTMIVSAKRPRCMRIDRQVCNGFLGDLQVASIVFNL